MISFCPIKSSQSECHPLAYIGNFFHPPTNDYAVIGGLSQVDVVCLCFSKEWFARVFWL